MRRRPPLEERIAQCQARLPPAREHGQLGHPTARYPLIALPAPTVAGHVIGGVLPAVLAH
ncbi:hypothetical protein ACFVH6_33120 [Spirillospora sp. NPDC127200]